MSISSIFGSPILLFPDAKSSFKPENSEIQLPPTTTIGYGGCGGLLIECSSRPKKKATARHMKTRPRKSQPWDIRRKPAVYPPLPTLPADWTLVSSSAADDGDGDGGSVTQTTLPSTPALQAAVTSG